MVTKAKKATRTPAKRAPKKTSTGGKRKPAPNGVDPSGILQLVEAGNDYDIAGPDVRDGMVYLSSQDLAALELARMRRQTEHDRAELIELREAQAKASYEAAQRAYAATRGALENDRKRSRLDLAAQVRAYDELKEAMAKRYAIDFDQVTYDDKTGKLFLGDAPIAAG